MGADDLADDATAMSSPMEDRSSIGPNWTSFIAAQLCAAAFVFIYVRSLIRADGWVQWFVSFTVFFCAFSIIAVLHLVRHNFTETSFEREYLLLGISKRTPYAEVRFIRYIPVVYGGPPVLLIYCKDQLNRMSRWRIPLPGRRSQRVLPFLEEKGFKLYP